jgi:DNA-binding CsgD family transcriptional regulator
VEGSGTPSDELEPVQRLTPAQRQALLETARTGSAKGAAESLGVAVPTIKNQLTDVYRRLGVRSGMQAIYLVMGGRITTDQLPEPTSDVSWLRARVRRLEGLLRRREAAVERLARMRETRGERGQLPPLAVPVMVDGRIRLADIRAASLRCDADAERSSTTLMTATEWADWIGYYVQPANTDMVSAASS